MSIKSCFRGIKCILGWECQTLAWALITRGPVCSRMASRRGGPGVDLVVRPAPASLMLTTMPGYSPTGRDREIKASIRLVCHGFCIAMPAMGVFREAPWPAGNILSTNMQHSESPIQPIRNDGEKRRQPVQLFGESSPASLACPSCAFIVCVNVGHGAGCTFGYYQMKMIGILKRLSSGRCS